MTLPGSPERARGSLNLIVGDLIFLDRARACRNRHASFSGREDGRTYFIHGWTQVIAEVFDVEIPDHRAAPLTKSPPLPRGYRADERAYPDHTPVAVKAAPSGAGALVEAGSNWNFAPWRTSPTEVQLVAALPGVVGWLAGVEKVSEAAIGAPTGLRHQPQRHRHRQPRWRCWNSGHRRRQGRGRECAGSPNLR